MCRLVSIGTVHSEQGDNKRALECYYNAKAAFEAAGAGVTPSAAGCLMSIGAVLHETGEAALGFEHVRWAADEVYV